MEQKYFLNSFAESGDKTAVPDALDPSGYVSYEQGYGFDYERNNDGSDPLAKNIERQKMNELFFDMTSNLQQYQQHGTPEFITSANNGGTAYSYNIDAEVLYDDSGTGANWRKYRSKANANTALPTDTTKWELAEYAALAPNYTGVKASNIASAATVNIGAATGDYMHVTGTTTITAFDTIAAGIERTLVFDGILTLTHSANLILPRDVNITTAVGDTVVFKSEGSGVWRCVSYDRKDGTALAGTSSSVSGVRQTVQKASVDSSGLPNFITAASGLSVNILGATTNIAVHAAGGKVSDDRAGTISIDTTISGLVGAQTISTLTYSTTTATCTTSVAHGLTTGSTITVSGATPAAYNGTFVITVTDTTHFTYTMLSNPAGNASPVGSYTVTNFLYADIAAGGTITLGSTLLIPVYQFGGTYSTTNNQATFNISEMTMKVGNGSSAVQVWRTFKGEAVTNASAVTSVVNYAVNGIHISTLASVPATINTKSNFNHNIGVALPKINAYLKCITANQGYQVGEIIPFSTFETTNLVVNNNFVVATSRNTCYTQTGANDPIGNKSASTGVLSVLTPASWNQFVIAKRGW
jgi:hypothetical protein